MQKVAKIQIFGAFTPKLPLLSNPTLLLLEETEMEVRLYFHHTDTSLADSKPNCHFFWERAYRYVAGRPGPQRVPDYLKTSAIALRIAGSLIFHPECIKKLFAHRASPRPAGELTVLPRLVRCFWEKEPFTTRKGNKRKGEKRKKRKQKGGRERKGTKFYTGISFSHFKPSGVHDYLRMGNWHATDRERLRSIHKDYNSTSDDVHLQDAWMNLQISNKLVHLLPVNGSAQHNRPIAMFERGASAGYRL